ncbi:MAG: alkaline phosphatase family protein [Nocardioidaceae bacterium]
MTSPSGTISRRGVLAGAGAAIGAAAIGDALPATAASRLPSPERSGIDHVVVVMMENRSFDHYWGWLPGADGQQSGLSYVDSQGVRHRTHHLSTYQGCAHPDPDHSFEGGRVELNDGACDGWLRAGSNDAFSIGYYTGDDLSFFGRAAKHWTSCDRYFSAIMAETYPNRFYQHSAQTDRIHNSTDTSTLPTIWDRLAEAGLTGRYYFSHVPFTALWGTKYTDISKPYAQFLADAAAGSLPEVSFVDPKFLDEGSGTSADDHPHATFVRGSTSSTRCTTPPSRAELGQDGDGGQLRRVGRLLRPRRSEHRS